MDAARKRDRKREKDRNRVRRDEARVSSLSKKSLVEIDNEMEKLKNDTSTEGVYRLGLLKNARERIVTAKTRAAANEDEEEDSESENDEIKAKRRRLAIMRGISVSDSDSDSDVEGDASAPASAAALPWTLASERMPSDKWARTSSVTVPPGMLLEDPPGLARPAWVPLPTSVLVAARDAASALGMLNQPVPGPGAGHAHLPPPPMGGNRAAVWSRPGPGPMPGHPATGVAAPPYPHMGMGMGMGMGMHGGVPPPPMHPHMHPQMHPQMGYVPAQHYQQPAYAPQQQHAPYGHPRPAQGQYGHTHGHGQGQGQGQGQQRRQGGSRKPDVDLDDPLLAYLTPAERGKLQRAPAQVTGGAGAGAGAGASGPGGQAAGTGDPSAIGPRLPGEGGSGASGAEAVPSSVTPTVTRPAAPRFVPAHVQSKRLAKHMGGSG